MHHAGRHWRLLRYTDVTIEHILEGLERHDRISLLLDSPGSMLDDLLYSWQKHLRVGDEVDCVDDNNRWYDAVILKIEKEMLTIHFRGWSSDFNISVPYATRPQKRLQPLYTQEGTKWRLELSSGSLVDVYTSDGWCVGQVKAIDSQGRLEIECSVTKLPMIRIVDKDSEEICRLHSHTPEGSEESLKRHAGVGVLLNKQLKSSYSAGLGNRRNTGRGIKGATGLNNLGNTCFMNSMLQCLSHTQSLTSWFLSSDAYLRDLNEDNPLGLGGRIAIEYANLLKELWSGDFSSVSPSAFKAVIGEFAPQFAGYQQQDSQELMSCVLDGLHEDLNRIKRKPYVPTIDSNDRPDDIVSREAWTGHLRRNDSVVNDLFFGQMKSHITCQSCGATSVTFDPFSSLSLPLPISNTCNLRLPVFGMNRAMKLLEFPIDPAITLTSLKAIISKELRQDSSVHFCLLSKNGGLFSRVHKTLRISCYVEEFRKLPELLVAYELPGEAELFYTSDHLSSTVSPKKGTIDILFGVKDTSYSNFTSTVAKCTSAPRRMFCLTASRNELYERVASIIRDSLDGDVSDIPEFALYTVSLEYSSISLKQKLPRDDELFTLSSNGDTLICVWQRANVKQLSMGAQTFPEGGQYKTGAKLALRDCLDKFSESEQLAPEDTFYCGKCKQHLAPVKKLDVWASPDVLIIHLKRFNYSRATYLVQREKISNFVDFPLQDLDLTPYVKGPISSQAPPIYDLFAVSEHSGGLGGGHYTAKCLNFIDGQWYDFNDSIVGPTSPESCLTERAYVLFYRRKLGSLRWGGLQASEVDAADEERKENGMDMT